MFSFGKLRSFASDRKGGVATIFSLSVPLLGVAAGMAIDFSMMSHLKAKLQAAADAGAVAGARELTLATKVQSAANEVALQTVNANLKGNSEYSAAASRTEDGFGMRVTIQQQAKAYFGGLLNQTPKVIAVEAIANSVSAEQKICVLGLDEQASHTVSLDKDSGLTAKDCGVYSNSRSSIGLRAEKNTLMTAKLICSSGGRQGADFNFSPRPLLDCPVIKDPLASRAPPPVGPCKEVSLVIKAGQHTLAPGTYCNGLNVDGNAIVTLSPGVYVIKDGPLSVDTNAQLNGTHVGIFFTGNGADFKFTKNASVSLSAPKDGPMAGLLFYEDRNNKPNAQFKITSDYTRTLLGTIYLPQGRFVVDATAPVADQSTFTVIVARKIELDAGPNLVVNSDYESTPIPVPPGVGRVGAQVRLNK